MVDSRARCMLTSWGAVQVLAAAEQAVHAVRVLVAPPASLGRSSSPAGNQEAADGSVEEDGVPKLRGGRRRVELPLDPDYATVEANRAFDELGKAVELWAQRVSADAIRPDLGPVSMGCGGEWIQSQGNGVLCIMGASEDSDICKHTAESRPEQGKWSGFAATLLDVVWVAVTSKKDGFFKGPCLHAQCMPVV